MIEAIKAKLAETKRAKEELDARYDSVSIQAQKLAQEQNRLVYEAGQCAAIIAALEKLLEEAR